MKTNLNGSKFAGLELDVEKPQRMPLLHPTTRAPLRDKDGKDAWIDVYSNDSSIARRHNFNTARRRMNATGRNQRIRFSPEELEAEGIDLLAALTTDWHLVTLDGEPMGVKYTLDEARDLYKTTWVREQVDDFVTDRANFPPPSLKS